MDGEVGIQMAAVVVVVAAADWESLERRRYRWVWHCGEWRGTHNTSTSWREQISPWDQSWTAHRCIA
jgi:hypothetical protein